MKTYDKQYDWLVLCIVIIVCALGIIFVYVFFSVPDDELSQIEEPETPVKIIELDNVSFESGPFLCEVRDGNGDEVTSITGKLEYIQRDTYSMLISTDEQVREMYGKKWIYQITEVVYFLPSGKLEIYPVERE